MSTTTYSQINFTGGEISPHAYARIDLNKYNSSAAKMLNYYAEAEGGASNRPGFKFIGEAHDGNNAVRLLPFQFNEQQSYSLEFGNQYMRVVYNGGIILNDDNSIFILDTPYLSDELETLIFRQSNDILYLTHRNHAPRKLLRTDHNQWTLEEIGFEPQQAAPTNVRVTTSGGDGDNVTYRYVVTAVNSETGEESVRSSEASVSAKETEYKNTVSWNAASGADLYHVYKEKNDLFGFIGSSEGTTFSDDEIEEDLEDTAPKLRQPFEPDGSDDGNYPGVVGLHEQRTVWCNSDNNPLTFWMSQTSNFENMNTSTPTKASDAVTARVVNGQGNEIRHVRSHQKKLFVFTSGAVFSVTAGGDSDAITPSSKQIAVEENLSSTYTPPITIKSNILMVAGKANQGFEVHSLGYDYNTDGYQGSDLTVLSRHLFRGYTIKEWCYLERPYRLVLAVRSDGKILCMTYLNEHQIFSWALWETDGEFESICHVPEGQEDVCYVVVKRTINGQEVRYIERMESRLFDDIEDAFFVDCGGKYEGAEISTITGLDFLEGQEVVVLNNGDLEENHTVTSGEVTLNNPTTKAIIGKPYIGTIQTLPINFGLENMSNKKGIKGVSVRVHNTRGVYIGSTESEGDMEEYPTREDASIGEPADLLSGLLPFYPISTTFTKDIAFILQSAPALPSTILSCLIEVEGGGK